MCHIDLIVVNKRSRRGHKYWMHVVDEGTTFEKGYALRRKGAAAEKFKEYEAEVRLQFPDISRPPHISAVKILRSDGEGALTSKEFQQYMAKRGIHPEPTTGYTPQHNGKAEKHGEIVANALRCLLFQARLPASFWVEAAEYATYVKNMCPSKVYGGRTPFEQWHHYRPTVGHLKTFGCICYAKVPSELLKKLDSRTVRSVFLGCDPQYNGYYKVMHIESGRMFISRDVVFREDQFLYPMPQIKSKIGPPMTNQELIDLVDDGYTESDLPSQSPDTAPNPQPSQPTGPVAGDGGVDEASQQQQNQTPHVIPSDVEEEKDGTTNEGVSNEGVSNQGVQGLDFSKLIDSLNQKQHSPLFVIPEETQSPEHKSPHDDPICRDLGYSLNDQMDCRRSSRQAGLSPDLPAVIPRELMNAEDCKEEYPGVYFMLLVTKENENSVFDKCLVNKHKKVFHQQQQTPHMKAKQELLAMVTSEEQSDINSVHYKEPKSYTEALASKEHKYWRDAIDKEIMSIEAHDCYTEVTIPYGISGRKILTLRWVFKRKLRGDGSLDKYKARLCAQGFKQIHGVNYDEVYSPTLKHATMRTLFTIAACQDLELLHWDVSTAFLNAKLQEDIYCKIPQGFEHDNMEGKVWKLNRALYGLKQAPAAWHKEFKSSLKELGFTQSVIDPCIFKYDNGKDKIRLGVFVDDIAVAATSTALANKMYSKLAKKYTMTNFGDLEYFCGISIQRNRKKRTMFLSQPKYTMEILKRFNHDLSIPKYTPLAPGCDLHRPNKLDYTWPIGKEHEDYLGPYRSKVGSLLYLALSTRPDIAHAVSKVAQFNSAPTHLANKAVNHIFKYLNGTRDFGITLGPDFGPVHTFTDAAHTIDPGMQAVTGYITRIGTSPIMWQSKKQVLTTLSTMESELDALATSTIPSMWLRDLLTDLVEDFVPYPITMMQDNQGTIHHCNNEHSSNRTAHLRRRYHFIHQYIELGNIKLKYSPGTEMIADQLTKCLSRPLHEKHCRHFISVADPDVDPFSRPALDDQLRSDIEKAEQEKKAAKKTAKTKETCSTEALIAFGCSLICPLLMEIGKKAMECALPVEDHQVKPDYSTPFIFAY